MDDRLTWKHHIYELRKKVNRSIGIIYKMKHLCPLSVLLSLYYSLVHSHLNYGICVWGHAAAQEIDKLFLAQKKVVRIISNADYIAPSNPLFAKLGILKVQDIFKSQLAGLMWDHDNGDLPKCFDTYFTRVKNVHSHGTRLANANKLSVNVAVNTSTHGQTMFKYIGPRIFNELKGLHFYDITKAKKTFRKNYKIHMITSYL